MTTLQLQQGPINRPAVEAAARFHNPTAQPVQWTPAGFTLYRGHHAFDFRLDGAEAKSPWHTGNLSDYTECWRLSAVTGQMSFSRFFGTLFGLPELAKQLRGQLREGKTFSLYHWQWYETPGQLRLNNGDWLSVVISSQGEDNELLLIGGVPAGMIWYPNRELMAYQHLPAKELAQRGIPQLSPEEQLPKVWAPAPEAVEEIRQGLREGASAHDFILRPWAPWYDQQESNIPLQTIQQRTEAVKRHQELLRK